MPDLSGEIQRALAPTYGPDGVSGLLRRYHDAKGVPHGAMHAFYTTRALDLPGSAGSYASTPDSNPLDITGDIDLRLTVRPGFDWRPAAASGLVNKFQDGPAQWSWLLLLSTTGALQFYTSPDNVALVSATSSVAVPVGTRRVRVTRAAATGAVNFYTTAGDDETWVALGAPQATTAGGIFAGTSRVVIGSDRAAGTSSMLTGKVQRLQIRNGIDGTIVASPDFAAQPVGTASFTDAQGNVWTISGAASVVASDGREALSTLMLTHFGAMP